MCLVIFVSVRLQSVQLSWEMYFKMLSFDRTYTLLLRAVFVLFGSSEGDFLSLCSQINTLKCDCVQKGLPLVYTCPLCNYKAQESHLQLRWHLTISAQSSPWVLATHPQYWAHFLSDIVLNYPQRKHRIMSLQWHRNYLADSKHRGCLFLQILNSIFFTRSLCWQTLFSWDSNLSFALELIKLKILKG